MSGTRRDFFTDFTGLLFGWLLRLKVKVSLWFRVQALGFEITRLETLNPDRSFLKRDL